MILGQRKMGVYSLKKPQKRSRLNLVFLYFLSSAQAIFLYHKPDRETFTAYNIFQYYKSTCMILDYQVFKNDLPYFIHLFKKIQELCHITFICLSPLAKLLIIAREC